MKTYEVKNPCCKIHTDGTTVLLKSFLSTCTLFLLLTFSVLGQSRELKLDSSSDYSQFSISSKNMTISLKGVSSNDIVTGLFFKIVVNNNSESSFAFKDDYYISGAFGTMHPIAIKINGKKWELNKDWWYDKGNKGLTINVLLIFNRIPAGISRISYGVSDGLLWDNIPVDKNPDPVPHSNWDEQSLREHWDSNGCTNIEGIYYFTKTNDTGWWGTQKHTLAVFKEGHHYFIIYLKGSNKQIWTEGDVKATFVASAVPGLYKATSWFMENRLENEDFYIKFVQGTMSIYENTPSTTADFLKLYPANDINQ